MCVCSASVCAGGDLPQAQASPSCHVGRKSNQLLPTHPLFSRRPATTTANRCTTPATVETSPAPPPPSLVHRRHQTRGQHGFLASLGSFLQTTPSADEKEIWTRRHSATLPWLRRRLPGWTLEGIRSPLTNCTHTGCGPSVAAALCGPLGHDMIASQPPGRVPTVRHSCSMAVRVIGVTTHVCTGPVEWCSVAQTRQARPSCWPAGSRTRARPWCVTTVYHQPPSGLCRCS